MVTFTATLGSDGTGKLSNNAVSGRTVVLQQRLSVGLERPRDDGDRLGAGRMRASLNAWSTRDYRALFRKPSGEGLRDRPRRRR